MNDTELNEKIAGWMGWKMYRAGTNVAGVHCWYAPNKRTAESPPDYLDDPHLSELLRLAATLGRWELCVEPQGNYFAQIELPSDDDDDDPHATGKGVTPSLAVARAIVAHKEKA